MSFLVQLAKYCYHWQIAWKPTCHGKEIFFVLISSPFTLFRARKSTMTFPSQGNLVRLNIFRVFAHLATSPSTQWSRPLRIPNPNHNPNPVALLPGTASFWLPSVLLISTLSHSIPQIYAYNSPHILASFVFYPEDTPFILHKVANRICIWSTGNGKAKKISPGIST